MRPVPPPLRNDVSGWPWTVDERSVGNDRAREYPRISIVTPSFNQAGYLETTIRSVLLQGYPNLEYIIIDGGSTDASAEIIRHYESHISYWVSEKDRGQAHAINKGMEHATGELRAYLNSDDYYLPNALWAVAQFIKQRPTVDLVHGRCRYVDASGVPTGSQFGEITSFSDIVDLWDVWWKRRQFVQPEVFWTAAGARRVGAFREDLHYVMDFEYWSRLIRNGARVGRIDAELSCFRFTPGQKSSHATSAAAELLDVVRTILWDDSAPISVPRRALLQGKWLFDCVFRREAERAAQLGFIRRASVLAGLLASHPQILFAPEFRARLSRSLRARLEGRRGLGKGDPVS